MPVEGFDFFASSDIPEFNAFVTTVRSRVLPSGLKLTLTIGLLSMMVRINSLWKHSKFDGTVTTTGSQGFCDRD
jgi:hypothetical protein